MVESRGNDKKSKKGNSNSNMQSVGSKSQQSQEIPRDVRLLRLIFATQGIQNYQDHVPLQLMDFAYRYTSEILHDAIIYNDHAHANINNAGNAGSHHSQISNEDIRLAIAARTSYQFQPVPPKKMLMKLAAERNEKPLPPVMPMWGIRLPPEKYCLSAKEWKLDDEELTAPEAKRRKAEKRTKKESERQ
ncbi:hypothetical protein FOA43_003059 [Brettanomyces nanus]|uniref:Transcription initiation factor TFIID subunit 9 n=1 Tax=Eeniella nana TaxID=13502 RepID=A0A875RQ03_EENNA|nr:uncharacterized protein FOA43_003059 [Brettanomyces nanus]QPG75700.1 hypothetical protein FOA43_003059 [Brettanomyces nanus]